ncbi:MAG: NAD(P)-dependent oxidoreductase [Burkholderiales bacterium]
MAGLKGKTLFITGASRGIGRAIALRVARDGANVVLAAKTSNPHPKLSGTIHSVAAEIEAAGGKPLPLQVDVREENQIYDAVNKAVEAFGGIDILVNNASALSLTNVQSTTPKRFDLMVDINVRGSYACAYACIPHLKNATNPHILTLSPPINLKPKWFKPHTAYTISKYAMSMVTLGLAAELAEFGIAANSLWPRTTIATAALETFFADAIKASRTAEVMADAAYVILTKPSRSCTGNFFIDEAVLRAEGVSDFSPYAVTPGEPLMTDLFLD